MHTMRRSTYALVARVLVQHQKCEELATMLRSMWNTAEQALQNKLPVTCLPDEKMCALAANVAGECKKLALARNIISEMEKHGIKAGPYSYAVLIKAYGRANNDVGITRTLQRMKARRIQPDQVVLNSAIDAYIRCHNFVRARQLLSTMSEWGLRPNERSYNTILKGLAEISMVDEAFAMKQEMLDVGLVPNSVTRNILIQACVNANMWPRAQALVREIRTIRNNNPDDVLAYNIVINGLAKLGRFVEAFEVLKELEARGGRACVITYTSLVSASLKEGDLSRAWFLFRGMRRLGVEPSLDSYRAMIHGLCHYGQVLQVEAAHRLVHEMNRKFPQQCPDIQAYNLLMDGYSRVENMREAMNLLDEMRALNAQPDLITYTTLITGYSKQRNLAQIRFVFNELKRSGLALDRASLNAFVGGAVRCDDMQLALQVFQEMERVSGSLAPDLITFSALISGHLYQGNPEDAWKMYSELRQRGIALNQRVLEDVLRLCLDRDVPRSRVFTSSQSLEVLRDMERAGVSRKLVERWKTKWRVIYDIESFSENDLLPRRPAVRRTASQQIFEKHQWNEIDSGFRAL